MQPPTTQSTRLEVHYRCPHQAHGWRVVLDPTRLPVCFFGRRRRDEIWGPGAKVMILSTPDHWQEAHECLDGGLLLEGPQEIELESGSGDCFCFEDDLGKRYCVCGMM